MNVRNPLPKTKPTGASVRPAWMRVLAGYLGALALLLQLLAPSFSYAGPSDWVEICSEQGAVWIEIDAESGEPVEKDCPKCGACLFCAIGDGVVGSVSMSAGQKLEITLLRQVRTGETVVFEFRGLWLTGRGPPPPLEHTDRTERAARASMAATLKTGGVPWT